MQIKNRGGVERHTFDAGNFKADLMARIGERMSEIGKNMKSCRSNDQFRRMAEAMETQMESADRKWLTQHNINGPEVERYMELFKYALRNGVNAVNQSLQLGG